RPRREPPSLISRRRLNLPLTVHAVNIVARTLDAHVPARSEPRRMDTVRPRNVLPTIRTESRIHAANGLHNAPLNIKHMATSRMIRLMHAVIVKNLNLALRHTLGPIKHSHEV